MGTAYIQWLLRESDRDEDALVRLIYSECINQNEMAMDLMIATGEHPWNMNTVRKVAKNLLEL